jgi:hypothetical protein
MKLSKTLEVGVYAGLAGSYVLTAYWPWVAVPMVALWLLVILKVVSR